MSLLVASLITLGVIGCVAAIVLYFVATKFKVEEDARIDEVEASLPGANCGGCGYPGCRGFASACVGAESLDGKFCPVGGQPVMEKVAGILGLEAGSSTPKVAVLRCNGSCANRPKITGYDGVRSCKVVSQLYAGQTGCAFGCTGFGDCEAACAFDALHVNPGTGLPEIDEEKCTACGKCVKACPKSLIELRNKGPKNRRVYVACNNKDKGGVARKACSAACIGCGKCAKACPFGAITVENNLAYIDFNICRLCRKCVVECPTGAIHAVNFPTPPPAPVKKEEARTVASPSTSEPVIEIKIQTPVENAQVENVQKKKSVDTPVGTPVEKPMEQREEKSVQTQTVQEPQIVAETEVAHASEPEIEIVIDSHSETEVVEVQEVKPDTTLSPSEPVNELEVDTQLDVEAKSEKPTESEVEIKSEDEEKTMVEGNSEPLDTSKPLLDIPEDVDINSLIDPSLMVKPLETKTDEHKTKNDKNRDNEKSLFDLD